MVERLEAKVWETLIVDCELIQLKMLPAQFPCSFICQMRISISHPFPHSLTDLLIH